MPTYWTRSSKRMTNSIAKTYLPIHTRPFAVPKTDKEIEDVISAGVSKKTRDDTKYCVKIWINGKLQAANVRSI